MSRRFEFFGGDGAIQDLDNENRDLSPEEFWEQLPERCRLALAKAAPKVARPWELDVDDFDNEQMVRRGSDGRIAASVALVFCDFSYWVERVPFRSENTRAAAMDAADEALRAKGWVLE